MASALSLLSLVTLTSLTSLGGRPSFAKAGLVTLGMEARKDSIAR